MTLSAWALVAANLLPLAMAAGGGWGLAEILPLYWFESAIIGFFTLIKILTASGGGPPAGGPPPLPASWGPDAPRRLMSALGLAGRIFLAVFFTVHFGIFMAVHGVFLFGLILGGFKSGRELDFLSALASVKWGVAALVLSHAVSFAVNYLAGGERLRVAPPDCMMAPYPRIIVMHLTILLGAFLSAMLGNAAGVLVIFVALKVLADLRAHLGERRRAAARPQA